MLSQSPAQFSSLWALREGVSEAAAKEGKVYKYDVSVPLSSFKEVVDNAREHLRSQGLLHDKAVKHVIGFGHVGDGGSYSIKKDCSLNNSPRKSAFKCYCRCFPS